MSGDVQATEIARAVSRSRWVVEVHLTRAGLWDQPVGLDIRAAWARGDELDPQDYPPGSPADTTGGDRG